MGSLRAYNCAVSSCYCPIDPSLTWLLTTLPGGLYSCTACLSACLSLQVWLNYKRQSTLGWNINQVLLDFSGGVFSLFQLCMEAFVKVDMSAISGDPVKFGLGLVTVIFDIMFMIQHYSLYKVNNAKLLEEAPKARYTMVSPSQSGSRRTSQQDEQLLLASATTSVSEEGMAGPQLTTSSSMDVVSPRQSSERGHLV